MDRDAGKPEELLERGELVEERTSQEARPRRGVDHRNIEAEPEQVEEVAPLHRVRVCMIGDLGPVGDGTDLGSFEVSGASS